MTDGICDFHQHLLWGLDDGPETAEACFAMLRESHRQGVRVIAATPHAYPGFRRFDLELYRARLARAQAYCDENALDMRLLPGAEITYTYQCVRALLQGRLPTLGGTNYALIELWRAISWREAREAVCALLRAGFTPVLAHVERYRCFVLEPRRALAMHDELNVRYQLNAGALVNKKSLLTRRFCDRMLEAGGVDLLASDAHDTQTRPQNMRAAYRLVASRYGAALADALTRFEGIAP